jgi:hypothetical protein
VHELARARACTNCGGGALAVRSKVDSQDELYLRCRSCRAKFDPEELC